MKAIALLALVGGTQALNGFFRRVELFEYVCENKTHANYPGPTRSNPDIEIALVEECLASYSPATAGSVPSIGAQVLDEVSRSMGMYPVAGEAEQALANFGSSCQVAVQGDGSYPLSEIINCLYEKADDGEDNISQSMLSRIFDVDPVRQHLEGIWKDMMQVCNYKDSADGDGMSLSYAQMQGCLEKFDMNKDSNLKEGEWKNYLRSFVDSLGRNDDSMYRMARVSQQDPKRGLDIKSVVQMYREIINNGTEIMDFESWYKLYHTVASFTFRPLKASDEPLALDSLVNICKYKDSFAQGADGSVKTSQITNCFRNYGIIDKKVDETSWTQMARSMKNEIGGPANVDVFLNSGLPAIPFSVLRQSFHKKCGLNKKEYTLEEVENCLGSFAAGDSPTAKDRFDYSSYNAMMKFFDSFYEKPYVQPNSFVPFEVMSEFCGIEAVSGHVPSSKVSECIRRYDKGDPDSINAVEWEGFQKDLGEFYEDFQEREKQKRIAEREAKKQAAKELREKRRQEREKKRQEREERRKNRGRGLKELITQN